MLQHSQTKSFFTPTCLWRWNRQSVPKRRHVRFGRRGITQKKAYKIAVIHVAVVLFLQWTVIIVKWSVLYSYIFSVPCKACCTLQLWFLSVRYCRSRTQFSRFALGLLPYWATHHTRNGSDIGSGHVANKKKFTSQSTTVYLFLRDSISPVCLEQAVFVVTT